MQRKLERQNPAEGEPEEQSAAEGPAEPPSVSEER
jgi:hypothetical protein